VPERKYCFVAMPFLPELNYFFLYLQQYLESQYDLCVERGDAQVSTTPLMDKVKAQILKADLIIGDVTGNNPNVLYEVGIAHAIDKPVLLLTQNDPEKAPIDIRHCEFIQYHLAQHEELLVKLANAVTNVFAKEYEHLFKVAQVFLDRFNKETGLRCQSRSVEIFQASIMRTEKSSGIPSSESESLLAEVLLPLVTDLNDSKTIDQYRKWVSDLPN